MSRAGWTLGVTWLVTCLIGAWLSFNVLLTVLAVSVIACLTFLCVPALRCRTLLLVGAAISLSLLSLLLYETDHYLPVSRLEGMTVTLRARVCDTDGESVIRVMEGDLPAGTQLHFRNCSGDSMPDAYDIVSGTFTLYGCDESGLALLQCKASGVYGSVMPTDSSALCVEQGDVPWTAVFGTWRRSTVKQIQTYLSGDEAAVVCSICLGADEGLSAAAEGAFRACGISHLFAVSGFHLALITQMLGWLWRKCGLPSPLRALFTAVPMLFFMALVGFGPSVVRAGTLCLLTQLSTCFKRQADGRNSLGIALLLLLAGNPYAAYDVGLLLSFLATLGLLCLAPALQQFMLSRIPERKGRPASRGRALAKRFIGACSVTLSASVATLPVVIVYFGEISLVSLPANLLASYPASVLLMLGSLACLLYMCGGAMPARGLLFAAGWIARFLLFIAEKISSFSLSTVAIQDKYLVLWIIGSCLLVYIGGRRLRRRGIYLTATMSAFTLAVSLLIHTIAMQGVTRVTVIPVEDDAAVCVHNSGRTVLLCAPDEVDELYTIRTGLREDGVRRVDVLILCGGEDAVLAAIPMVWDSYLEETVLLHTPSAVEIESAFAASYAFSDGQVSLWEGLSVARSGEFFCFTADGISYLVAPGGGNGYALLPEYRQVQTVICRGAALENAEAFGSATVVIPDEETIVLMTRGAGG